MMQRRYRRGDVWTVNLETVVGSEQGKVRPALVIQNDIGNHYSPILIVAAITGTKRDPQDLELQRSLLENANAIVFGSNALASHLAAMLVDPNYEKA